MVRKRLTLSVDEQVIERARRYSERHNTTLSQLVSNYLAQLDSSPGGTDYSPTVLRLIGILPQDTVVEQYHRDLEGKHSR